MLRNLHVGRKRPELPDRGPRGALHHRPHEPTKVLPLRRDRRRRLQHRAERGRLLREARRCREGRDQEHPDDRG